MKTLALVLVMALCALTALAAVPQTMSYQGVLRDASGNVVADGDYDLTFSLYTVPAGGTAAWTESQVLSVEGGIFDAILGANIPIATQFLSQHWLGVSVEGETELSPRVQLTSVPYAVHASYSDDAGDDGDWSVNGSDLYRYVGRIGIGTVTPNARLDIRYDADAVTGVRIGNNDEGSHSQESLVFSNEDGDFAGVTVFDDDSVYPEAMTIYNNRPQGNLRFHTTGVERMRISNIGFVGIGVAIPTQLLDVNGGVKMQGFEMPVGASDGYVLTSDGSGYGTWQSATGGGGLTLPYAGSAADTGAVFQVTNTDVGPAIRGIGAWPYNSTMGQIGDSFYGVFGQDLDTGNFGYLGHNSYGVHGKVYTDGKAVYGRHDPTMNYGYLGSETHAGYFGGNVTIADGNLGIGEDNPSKALYVAGEAFVTSYQNTRVLDILNSYEGQLAQMVNIERGGAPNALNDVLSVNSVAGSPDDFQFIECERGGAIEFAVDGSGLVYANGGADINGSTSVEGALYVDSSGLRGGEFLSDNLSHDTHVVHAEFTGTGAYDAVAVYGKCVPTENYGYGGYFEGGYYGVYSRAEGNAGDPYRGVYGLATSGTGMSYGVHGSASSAGGTARGVYGTATGTGTLHAGYFAGNVHVTGTLSKGAGSFKIDHPLDPENKYLYHSFVESPDMMNVYNGNVVLDAGGEALVELPDWFEALNSDFRYQLTAIGAPGPNLYVAEEIVGNAFRIAGGQPWTKISWQVTGVRQDAFANANRIPVEESKPAGERGKYMHADAFGMPSTMSVDYEEEPRPLPESGRLGAPEGHRDRTNEGDGE
jgi:hypothetical protein